MTKSSEYTVIILADTMEEVVLRAKKSDVVYL